jgi:pantothenate kinase
MSGRAIPIEPAALGSWVRQRSAGADRYLFGIAGPPGCGKSTLAGDLAETLDAPVVAMDGFHHTNATLAARGRLDVKGAPETFRSADFVELVVQLRDGTEVVECAGFDRRVDEPVPGWTTVAPGDSLVIVEGNYLLLDEPPWASLAELFDAIAYLDVSEEIRVRRLIDRHVEFGRSRADAAAFVRRSDALNAVRVEASRDRADLVVSL